MAGLGRCAIAELVRIVGAGDITSGNGWWAGGVTAPPAGSSLSRILRAEGHSYDMVVARDGEPLLDSELNLMQQIVSDKLDRFVQQMSLTGWTKAPGYPVKEADGDLSGNPMVLWTAAEQKLEFKGDAWLVAKGHLIHLSNPDVDNGNYHAVVLSGTRPASGVIREDLLFLEFWFEEIGPDGIGSTDSASRDILREGGIGNGTYPQSDANESLVDPVLNIETTRRVQLRWRLRVEESTGAAVGGVVSMFQTYEWGLTSAVGTANTAINARGATGAPVASYPFQVVESPGGIRDSSLGPTNGPALLWRTSIHTSPQVSAAALKTVDGFSYAVPILKLILDDGSGLKGEDMRIPSRLYIPDHSLHALQLAPTGDLNGAGVTGGLSSNGSVIEEESIQGGVGGDVGEGTITRYNLADGLVDETSIEEGAVHIQHINNDVGLPTRKLTNSCGERVYNGSVVTTQSGTSFIQPSVLNPADLVNIGIVENHDPLDPTDRKSVV